MREIRMEFSGLICVSMAEVQWTDGLRMCLHYPGEVRFKGGREGGGENLSLSITQEGGGIGVRNVLVCAASPGRAATEQNAP